MPRQRRRSIDAILDDARDRGYAAGEAAGSNVFDWGRMPGSYRDEIAFARKVSDLREDGDPRLDEYVVEPDWLSGEWAGESINELVGDLIEESGNPDVEDEILSVFEEGAHSGFWSAVDADLDLRLDHEDDDDPEFGDGPDFDDDDDGDD